MKTYFHCVVLAALLSLVGISSASASSCLYAPPNSTVNCYPTFILVDPTTGLPTTGGGSGGGSGGAIYGPTAAGATPSGTAAQPVLNGYLDGSGVVRSVAPSMPLPTQSANPNTVYSNNQTVTLSAAALPTQTLVNGIVVTAPSTNVATVYVGGSTVTATTGYKLAPGTSISYGVTQLSVVYILGLNTTDTVTLAGN